MIRICFGIAVSALLLASPLSAQDQSKPADETETAGGNCEEAKEQRTYWCEEREKVSVVSFGMECENAERNVELACGETPQEDKTSQ